MLSHTRMGVPYEYTHMGRPIRVWANIRIWGRTARLIYAPIALTDITIISTGCNTCHGI